ncbi:MAG: alkaline phosphatase family protein [Chthoniobacter sp.]|nr:alkaline phosphatase family protein [Chthoniobacter sp.]
MIPKSGTSTRKGWLSKAILASVCAAGFSATAAHAQQINTVFYILMENRNWTQGSDVSLAQIEGSSAAPYINSLITAGSVTPPGGGAAVNNSAQVSWCSCYHNVLSTSTGTPPSIHPSEPNYVWMEAGSNLSKLDDNDPYGSTNSVLQIYNFLQANPTFTGENLSGLLQNAGISWKAYQEGIDLQDGSGGNYNVTRTSNGITNNLVSVGSRTVPLVSFAGTSAAYTNPYNGSHQYNFAVKHCGSLFFPATNGSTVTTANTSTSNVAVSHYAPLEELIPDLTANTNVAQYNVITPDQFNDMHTALSGGFTYTPTTANGNFGTGVHYTGDLAQVAQGDNFLATLVPKIMASPVYQAGHAAIVIWTDETEGSPQNDFYHTLMEIVISPLAKGNAYKSTVNYTHSSDIATFQKVFGVTANTPTGYLNDAANASSITVGTPINNPSTSLPYDGWGTTNAQDLSDLFQSGVIPASIPGLNLTPSGFAFNRRANTYSQTVTVTNALSSAITNPVYLVVGNLTNTTLTNSAGTTVNNFPGNSYVSVSPSGLAAGASVTVTLQFSAPTSGGLNDTLSVINTASQP